MLLFGDVLEPGNGKTKIGRLWVYAGLGSTHGENHGLHPRVCLRKRVRVVRKQKIVSFPLIDAYGENMITQFPQPNSRWQMVRWALAILLWIGICISQASAENTPNINTYNIIYVDGCAGGTRYPATAAGINSAISTAISAGGGLVDARSCDGQNLTMNAEIDLGNASTVPVALLLPDSGTWTWSLTGGRSHGIKVFDKSSLIGSGAGEGQPFQLIAASTANMLDVVGTIPESGCFYGRLQGFTIVANSGATLTNGAFYLNGLCDSNAVDEVTVGVNGQIGTNVANACCGTVIDKLTSEGNFASGSQPLVLSGQSTGVAFVGGSAVHPGAGKNAVSITANQFDVNFYNLYMEGNNTDTTTPPIQIASGLTVSLGFYGVQYNCVASSSIAYVIDRASGVGSNGSLNVLEAGISCSGTDLKIVNDHVTGLQVTANANSGMSPPYFSDGAVVGSVTAGLKVGSGVAITSSGAGGTMTATIASGTAFMTTAAIGSGACGTTVTETATGVLTTDTIIWSESAQPTSPNGLLRLEAWPTSGNINFAWCNPTASSQTPAAETLNWRVVR